MKGRLSYRQVLIMIFICLIAVAYPLCRILPVDWGWENGVIEWSQCVLLLGCGVFTARFAVMVRESRLRAFWTLITFVVVVLVLRELSWGAVLTAPVGMGSHGPQFISRKNLPYGAAIHPVLAAYIVIWVVFAVKYKFFGVLAKLYKQGRLPILELSLTLLMLILSTCIEHMAINAVKDFKMIFEEYLEALAYLGGILVVICLKRQLTDETSSNNPR